MQPYQTYSIPMNNGYGQQNPYMDRMNFWQNYQQGLQQPAQQLPQMTQQSQQMNVIGKMIDSIDAVKAMDIPMDGSMYYFPKADGTEIYGKQWMSNGQTRILAFKPTSIDETNCSEVEDGCRKTDAFQELTNAFSQRFDELVRKIDELERSMTKPMTKVTVSRTKKENADNE